VTETAEEEEGGAREEMAEVDEQVGPVKEKGSQQVISQLITNVYQQDYGFIHSSFVTLAFTSLENLDIFVCTFTTTAVPNSH